jgi:phosphoribosylanthranilate isomerase
MSPAIKICGLTTAATLEATIRARADYAGFVFFPKSPRHLALADAPALAERAEGRIKRVGLFVSASDATIAEAVAAAQLNVLQLHGEETPQRAAELRAAFGLPVWKALPVATLADIARADAYAGAIDLVLFDAKTPKGALPGGMGLAFDWTLLAGWKGATSFPMGWGLAGGLSPDNVATAARITAAPLLDCSSGVESAPGVKNPELIASFCRAARAS